MADSDRYSIQVLDLALDVLEGVSNSGDRGHRPSQLARQLNLNRTRVFRILKTFEKRGYVQVDPKTQGYRLGIKFLALGEAVKEQIDLRRAAAPILKDLAQKTGDVVNLLVRYDDSAVCIDHFEGDHMLQVSAPLGKPLPLHIGASPKILLAFMPEAEREAVLQRIDLTPYTPNTITDMGLFRHRLDEICSQGYAVDEGDFEVGVYAIGAPVRDHSRQVVAGITVTVPAIRYNPQRKRELIELVVSTAQELSKQLGHEAIERA